MTNTAQLEKLLKQRDQLNERIKTAQARERSKSRKADTRKKILIGAIAQTHMDNNPASEFAGELRTLLNRHITKPKDRELLGLSPLTQEFNTNE